MKGHTSLLALMQPLPEAETKEPEYADQLDQDDAAANILSMVAMPKQDDTSDILASLSVSEQAIIRETPALDLSELEYQYTEGAQFPLTIEHPDGYLIQCPEVITSAIAGYRKGDPSADPTNLWNRAKVSAKSTSLSRPGNRWSWSYQAFLALLVRIAEAELEENPEGEALIRVCRICGRTACPYHGRPDGWVYIKVTL